MYHKIVNVTNGKDLEIVFNFASNLHIYLYDALLKEMERLRKIIVNNVVKQVSGNKPFKPLSFWTKITRDNYSNKALINTGQFLKSIELRKTPKEIKVGIFGGSKKGFSLVKIALINEFGITFTVELSQKQLAYLFYKLRKAGYDPSYYDYDGSNMTTITIPARPILRPAVKEWEKNLEKNVSAILESKLIGL